MAYASDSAATNDQDLIVECQERYKLAMDSESANRTEALTDINFANGDQWPVDIRRDRDTDGRPCLTINITDAMVRRVTNALRENRPRIKFHPVGDGADVQAAKVRNGLMRHIESASSADYAYDCAVESAVRGGWGYIRVGSRYVDERSFDQDLTIDPIRNPFTVYFDPTSSMPDGSDASWAIVSDMMRRDEYRVRYGDVDPLGWQYMGSGDSVADWATKEQIRGIMGQMLFRGEEGNKMTDVLSGGESCRLLFCKLMLQKPNILVLDEPTNHLDLEAVIALNDALQRYEGTILLVSHDEDIIDEVATRIWHLTDDGIEDFQGTYAEYGAPTGQ